MHRKRLILLLLTVIAAGGVVVVVAVVNGRSASASGAREPAGAARPSPDELAAFSTPAIETALGDPEKTLAFITAPETPFKERLAATLRGAGQIPPEFAPRVMNMIGELRDEYVIHGWGLKQHPQDCLPRNFSRSFAREMNPDRTVLGHAWRVPDARGDYPLTFAAESSAPWPWQVQQCLPDLLGWMTSARAGRNALPAAEHASRWMAACMTMPVSTDREARLFVEATQGGSWMHGKSMPVMARWLNIALDPSMPDAARRVAENLAGACLGWDHPQSLAFGDFATAEIVAHSPHAAARAAAAHQLYQLRYNLRESPPRKEGKEPTLSVAALCERAARADTPEWDRLYTYAISACKNLDAPPFEIDYRDVKPQSPESTELLAKFEAWYTREGPGLKRRAEQRRLELRGVLTPSAISNAVN